MRDAHREREGDMVIDTVKREPGAVGTRLHPSNIGKAGDIIGIWQQVQSTR